MKNYILILFALITISCSFDNKTGIWNDASSIPTNEENIKIIESNNTNSRYESIFTKSQLFNEEVDSTINSTQELDYPIVLNNWPEQYGTKTNNISNFLYNGKNILLSKSSKLSKRPLNKNIVFYENNLVSSDHKGQIFVYSLNLKKKVFEYDFYKNKFKNFEKKIYLTVSNKILYAADNIGYVYAIDLINQNIIWAKNYGIPFRSNIKIVDEQILLANQDNVIYSINSKTGNKNWQFATSPTLLKSVFKNNFAINELGKNLFFLNTSGELYSINYSNKKINWVLNFKNSSLAEDTDLFLSNPIIIKNNNLLISTEKALLNYDPLTSAKNWSFPSNSTLKPILTDNYTFTFSTKNLLICIENKTGKVLWSKDIYRELKETKKEIGNFYDFNITNNKINLFSKKGYLLSFDFKNGNLEYIKKISKNGLSSQIIFIKDNMFLIDTKNKLLKFN